MALSSTVSVTSSPTLLASGVGTVYVEPGGQIWVGDGSVTTSNGISVSAARSFVLSSSDELYAVQSGGGSTSVRVLHTR